MNTQELKDFLAKHKIEKHWETIVDTDISVAGYIVYGIPLIITSSGEHHKLFGELPVKALDIAVALTKEFENIKDQFVKEQVLRN